MAVELQLVFNEIDETLPIEFGDITYPLVQIPIATEEVLGGIKVGDNLKVKSDGTLSADGTESITNIQIEKMLGGITWDI